MTNIAISYRREDTAAISGRICDRLRARYGHGCVFMDVDSIRSGSDFRERIGQTIAGADALVVVIGKRWTRRKKGALGGEETDWAHAEVSAALAKNIPILPILVDGAAMPKPEALPESIRALSYLKAAELSSGEDFHPQIDRFLLDLDTQIAASAAQSQSFMGSLLETRLGWRSAAVSTVARLRRGLHERAARFRRFIASKSVWHWLSALVILAVVEWGEPYVQYYLNLAPVQNVLYQLISHLDPHRIEPKFTRVVSIGDAGRWRPHRKNGEPFNRGYLAEIVDKLHKLNVEIIALDFKVTLPNVQGDAPGDFREFQKAQLEETARFVEAIVAAANDDIKVVLSKSVWFGEKHAYALLADIYQPFGLCELDERNRWHSQFPPPKYPLKTNLKLTKPENISCGYIILPNDLRKLPPALEFADRPDGDPPVYLEPFSLAIARAHKPEISAKQHTDNYFTSYISYEALKNSSLDSEELLHGNASGLRSRIVLVGGNWYSDGPGIGAPVDLHEHTPAGTIGGIYVHQNFAEGLLDGREFGYVPSPLLHGLSVLFGLFSILVFARYPGLLAKSAVFLGLSMGLLAIQWLMLITLGTIFDAFVLLLALWLHSLFERLVH